MRESHRDQESSDRRNGRRRLVWASGLAAVAMLVAGGLIASESASAFGRGPWGHHGHDPEEMKEHMALAVDQVLRRLDASDEQRDEVGAIADRTFDALLPLAGEHRESRERMLEILSAETVDRDALEALRAESFTRFETASKTLTDGLADLAEVLTLEQRQELLEHAQRRRGWRRHW